MNHYITPAEEEAIRRSGAERGKTMRAELDRLLALREQAPQQEPGGQVRPLAVHRLTQADLAALVAGKTLSLDVLAPNLFSGSVVVHLVPPVPQPPDRPAAFMWGADVARDLAGQNGTDAHPPATARDALVAQVLNVLNMDPTSMKGFTYPAAVRDLLERGLKDAGFVVTGLGEFYDVAGGAS